MPEQDLNLNQLAVDQQADPELQHLRFSPTCSLQWCEVSLPGAPQPLVCDFSTGTPRPYLPPAYRRAVFNTLHNTTHPGIRASRHLVASKYVWENMNRDVTAWTRSCVPCQHSKDSLRATENVSTWFDALPLILLHLRTTLKPILGCSPAQLVYGTTLWIPGEFLHTSPTVTSAPVYVQELQLLMQALQPPSVDHHLSTASSTGYVPSALQQASHVFVRHDTVRKPLQPPYDGPYAVLERTTHHFTVNINNRPQIINIQRLKPAIVAE